MPLYDQEKMVKLVSEFRKSIERLNVLQKLKDNEFLGDPDKIASAKYHFIVAIESAIDMCNHVISRNGYRVPEDYGDTFRVMTEVGAFEKIFSEDLKTMAKFRNRLVHLYWEVDDHQLREILNTRLSDFKKFLDAIASFLNWKGKS
ncbi:DUF86 domain-containing protein [Thermodesulfobacteriota bacterium]